MSFLLQPRQFLAFTDPPPADAGFPVTNLADPQPKIVWRRSFDGPWAARITVDMGGDIGLDTFALLYHAGAPALTWRIWSRTAAQGNFGPGVAGEADATPILSPLVPASLPSTIGATRLHALHVAPSPVTARYVRIVLQDLTAGPQVFSAGVLAIGGRIQPMNAGTGPGADWGTGRRVVDLSEVQTLDGGERATWRRACVPEVRWRWSLLSDAELRQLWALQMNRGEGQPLLYVEDAAATTGLQERIHYGTLTGLDFYERRQADKSSWEFRLRHWL
ncbi:hypothetical protein [Thermaurantiacus tibetensis]|uniref:hypothetical protein n=1 Tax=Thermaurantiacus tibetensis TaxID=2759035 RepID=UPI00188ECF46|nr:hypothetical protein [Thermaurantiacus tibetensis]